MVLSEARQAGVSVLCSKNVGATDLPWEALRSVSLDDDIDVWLNELEILVSERNRLGPYSEVLWSWDDLAAFHLNEIYCRRERDLCGD